MPSTNIPDYRNIDYRGFAFVVHEVHGMLLLHCTRKPKKGPHFQLPGGHIDDYEFKYAAEKCGTGASPNTILLEAAKMGTARELFEETGIDVRGQLHRLHEAPLFPKSDRGCMNMLKNKSYFNLTVTDIDFRNSNDEDDESLRRPLDNNGSHLALKISNEHSGFIFESDPFKSIEKIQKHSGGTGSLAIRMLMDRGDGETRTERGATETYKSSMLEADLLPPPKRQSPFACFHNCC